MQNQENTKLLDHFEDDDQEEDSLSFSNLPLGNADNNSPQQSPRSVSSPLSDEPFEFFNGLSPGNSPKICAHVSSSRQIPKKKEEAKEVLNNENKRGGYLAMFRSVSFGKRRSKTCHGDQFMKNCDENRNRYVTKKLSSSARIDQQVNISALTSMSAKSRRRMFMFGPVKFKPEMELSAIKERQGKRVPSMMLSRAGGGGDTVVSGGERARKGGGDTCRWGLVRSRANLTALLARSFGCIPMGGMDRLITVSN